MVLSVLVLIVLFEILKLGQRIFYHHVNSGIFIDNLMINISLFLNRYVVLTTSHGILDHEEARRKQTGGKVLGFFFWKKSSRFFQFDQQTKWNNTTFVLFLLLYQQRIKNKRIWKKKFKIYTFIFLQLNISNNYLIENTNSRLSWWMMKICSVYSSSASSFFLFFHNYSLMNRLDR